MGQMKMRTWQAKTVGCNAGHNTSSHRELASNTGLLKKQEILKKPNLTPEELQREKKYKQTLGQKKERNKDLCRNEQNRD